MAVYRFYSDIRYILAQHPTPHIHNKHIVVVVIVIVVFVVFMFVVVLFYRFRKYTMFLFVCIIARFSRVHEPNGMNIRRATFLPMYECRYFALPLTHKRSQWKSDVSFTIHTHLFEPISIAHWALSLPQKQLNVENSSQSSICVRHLKR